MKYSVRLTNLVDANKMPPRTSSLQPNRIGAMHSEYIILKAINLDIPVGSFFKIGREERDNEKDVEEQIEEKSSVAALSTLSGTVHMLLLRLVQKRILTSKQPQYDFDGLHSTTTTTLI
jgi:hypothetical protein